MLYRTSRLSNAESVQLIASMIFAKLLRVKLTEQANCCMQSAHTQRRGIFGSYFVITFMDGNRLYAARTAASIDAAYQARIDGYMGPEQCTGGITSAQTDGIHVRRRLKLRLKARNGYLRISDS